ncbi:cellulase (glycosyl hydrolase family 5) [Paenibacillus cellulosilyticus]|uniref:Cellulase (Glycosyl hydrolase family 5) n=2 Tax=Paenibacillus cellulosilyticus TaxID=375489 RepID=A0A2V2YL67_9BACL|nr:cellulase (glycosyl hydrolase family 5) [Paenibacillus cellulosilyticus]
MVLMNNNVAGFVRAQGKKLVNGDGEELILRGVGLGSWFLPEGYMWKFPEQGDRPRKIERIVEELIGSEKAAEFWETYYDRYTAEADIRKIAEEGFNSIRIPINARAFIEDGEPVRFRGNNLHRLDLCIDWCRKYNVYAILDLHGATGGQTGANIDDSENDQPELFTNAIYRRMTIDLWRQLADRYKEEWIVAGYDLLNEPLPDWNAALNSELMPLYRDIVKAIREVDQKHMIVLEGAHWSTDWSIFDEMIDDNTLLQFHKYWNNPDTESIQTYINDRERLNAPIFMGEGGENNIDWYSGAFRLFEDHDISWNFWTWKKMDTINSPCSVNRPEGWDRLVDYLSGGERPSMEEAQRILWTYLDNIGIENCTYHPEVVNALFRRAPVRIPAIFYGYQGSGIGYHIGAKADRNVGFRVNDKTDIRFVDSEREGSNFQHNGGRPWTMDQRLLVQLGAGDWLAYEFTSGNSGSGENVEVSPFGVEIRLRATVESGSWSGLTVSLDGWQLGTARPSNAEWTIVRLDESVMLDAGLHRIVIEAVDGPIQVEWIDIV